MLKQIKISKKGLSVIIGYVLLITFAVIIGTIVYAWMNSYILTDKTECPDEVSLVVRSYTEDCTKQELELEFQNKGLFNISAFKIRGSTDASKEVATIGFQPIQDKNTDYYIFQKPLSPDGELQNRTINYYAKVENNINLAFVEITPYVFENGKSYICANAKIKQKLECSES